MKKLLFPLFMLAMIVTSCEKDPDMNKLDSDYSVYTDYDNSVHFNEFSTYYLPDSILVPDNSLKANYWKDEMPKTLSVQWPMKWNRKAMYGRKIKKKPM